MSILDEMQNEILKDAEQRKHDISVPEKKKHWDNAVDAVIDEFPEFAKLLVTNIHIKHYDVVQLSFHDFGVVGTTKDGMKFGFDAGDESAMREWNSDAPYYYWSEVNDQKVEEKNGATYEDVCEFLLSLH